jgi:hypothetical protein
MALDYSKLLAIGAGGGIFIRVCTFVQRGSKFYFVGVVVVVVGLARLSSGLTLAGSFHTVNDTKTN